MRHAIKKTVALIIAMAALAVVSAPAATARVNIHPPAYSQDTQRTVAIPTTAMGTSSSSDGFDWGDAAVGAGVMLALTGLVAGVVLVSRRGPGRSRPATTS
jgi:hypothetical protein